MVALQVLQTRVELAALCLGVWFFMKFLMQKAEVIMEALMGSAGTESGQQHSD